MFALVTNALIAAWTGHDRRARSAFTIKIYEMAARFPLGEELVIRLATGADGNLILSLQTPKAKDPNARLLGVQRLLGEQESPVVVGGVQAIPALPFAPVYRYAVRRFVFSADTSSRRRPLPPEYSAKTNLRGLCSALLEQCDASLELIVGPPDLKSRSIEEMIREANGPQNQTPELVATALRNGGNIVSATITLNSLNQPSARLLSEISLLGRPIEVIPWPYARDLEPEILGTRTLAAMFRIPVADGASFPGFAVTPSPTIRAPEAVRSTMKEGAIRLGHARDATGADIDVHLPISDLSRHIYVPGQTGAGKSTALRAMACEVARSGHGMLFIDPHGDAAQQLLRELPEGRARDVHYIDAADLDAPAPLNPFSVTDLLQRDTALANVTVMFQDLFDPTQQGIVGPRWESWFRMGMLTLIAAQGRHASILDVPRLFLDNAYMKRQRDSVTDEYLVDFWDHEMAQTNANTRSEILGWFTSKFTAFRTNAVLRAVLGSGRDTLDASEVMDKGRIIVVSLQKGEIGGPVAQLLGYLYLTRYWTAALKRQTARPFVLFVDEAQTFAKGSLPDILAEGRKFGLYAVIANQYLEQLPEQLQHALLGNVGTLLAFRMGDRDAEQFSGRLGPEFRPEALRRLSNHEAACSLLLDGAVQPAFTVSIDHISRLAGLSAVDMNRQAAAIIKSSRSYFRRSMPHTSEEVAVHSNQPHAGSNRELDVSPPMPRRPGYATPPVGAPLAHANIPTFVEALRDKKAREARDDKA